MVALNDPARSDPPPIDRKRRLAIPAQAMPKLPASERVLGWMESALPLAGDVARLEAERCIQCPAAPCTKACPTENDIPAAFALLERGDIAGAALVFRETSSMPDVCGRLCPQERLCEGACVVGKRGIPVAIGRLESYIADNAPQRWTTARPTPTGKRVAIAGSGPAGLAAAEELAGHGHAVTIYDAWPAPGGLLVYGIPNFKLDKRVVWRKIDALRALGVEFVMNTRVGADVTVDALFEDGYDAVFLAHGAGAGAKLGIEGEDGPGVLAATEFLVRGNLEPDLLPEGMREPLDPGRRVVVIGGGDTSMDCVRTAVRLGASDVVCLYRRTEAEMPGRGEERRNAHEEGVRFEFLAAPLAIEQGPDGARRVACQRMALGEPGSDGRRRPEPVPGSEFALDADTVVIAVGYEGDDLIPGTTPGLATHGRSLIEADPATGATCRAGLFAAGDAVHGADLVVTAMAAGRRAAKGIHRYLSV